MTLSERFVQERGWLRTDHFAVTKSLRSILEASALPVQEQTRLAYIQNKVVIAADEGKWASVPRRYWADKCGGQYKRYVETLSDWGQLEVDPSYRSTGNIKTSYPKSYRVPRSALGDGVCNVSLGRKRFRAPLPDNNPKDDVSRYALKCLSDLTVVKDGDFWLPEDPIHRARVKSHCEHIAFKDFGLTYGTNCKRLFHRVVMTPAEGRRNLKHYCLPLVEYDVKSCHPLLLVTFFDYDGERRRYQDLIATDIYTEIGNAMGVTDRDLVKTDFLRVVNAGWKGPEWLGQQYVFQFFQERFPHFTQSVLSTRTDLALTLQNFEAGLMVQGLGTYCRGAGLFWIPQHDGWISTVSDGEIICGYARKIISGAIDFPPVFTSHPLNAFGSQQ
ncbi:MAG: hypothetical protein P4L87_00965 [Formivibrio sp.]|nr:hypothetical protein [Formivibrio sp.]